MQSSDVRIRYTPFGAAREVFERRDRELLMSGPAGTGKSFACLFKVHIALSKHPGARGLLVRKTLESLKSSGLVTYTQKILHPMSGINFFGGNAQEPPHYRYPNGSKLMLGGMDKPKKVMSTEYDLIYVQEATEVTEEDWESLTTRLRNGVMPYQQLVADCNPDAPKHWLKLRCDRGQTHMLHSRHEDNPTVTEEYLSALRALTGVRRARLYEGIWAAADGIVFPEYDDRAHGLDDPPENIRQYIGAQDWGFANPGTLGVYGVDGDGRMCLVAEHYMTGRTMDWWVPAAQALHREYRLTTLVCDPSEPGFIKQYQDAGLPAVKAYNPIAEGIGNLRERLVVQPDGLPRLRFVRTALRERDEALVAAHFPFCATQEFAGYVWPKDVAGRVTKETPAPGTDHGMDQVRYACAAQDLMDGGAPFSWLTDDPTFRAAHPAPPPETDDERIARRMADYHAQEG